MSAPTSKMLKPPDSLHYEGPSVFLAGTIDNNQAPDWQTGAAKALLALPITLTVLNPRREHWDPNLRPRLEEPLFRQQVEWEFDGMKKADLIAMHFVENSKSPVTMLELGLFATSEKLLVSCPPGFYRRGNVEHACKVSNVWLFPSLDQMLARVMSMLTAGLKCPYCGKGFTSVELRADHKIPTHDWPPPCRQVCHGSGGTARSQHFDHRELWTDISARMSLTEDGLVNLS